MILNQSLLTANKAEILYRVPAGKTQEVWFTVHNQSSIAVTIVLSVVADNARLEPKHKLVTYEIPALASLQWDRDDRIELNGTDTIYMQVNSSNVSVTVWGQDV